MAKAPATVKEVIFHCDRHPEYRITMVPFNMKDDLGHKIKAHHLQFVLNPALCVGELRVKDKEAIEKVRDDEFFKSGRIKEVSEEEIADLPKKKAPPKVKSGVHDSSDVKLPSGTPSTGIRPVQAAKVPSRSEKK